jgi:hypothetical protein
MPRLTDRFDQRRLGLFDSETDAARAREAAVRLASQAVSQLTTGETLGF